MHAPDTDIDAYSIEKFNAWIGAALTGESCESRT